MNEISEKPNNAYNMRQPSEFLGPKVHCVFHEWIWSLLLTKSLMENFIFCAV